MLPKDLPEDLPSFVARFGTDEQCRAYLVGARWPQGFRCAACGHDRGWAHKARLVTSSKGGIAAMELKRQMGFGSYQTAWSWLHKIRKAMVAPDRVALAVRVEADETYVGGPRPGRPGRGAAGKTKVAGAVESGRGKAKRRRLGRLRLAVVADASARSHLATGWGEASLRRPAIHLVFGLAKRWLLGTHHDAVGAKHLPAHLDEHAVRIPPTTYRTLVAAPA